jgi:MFS family permease
MALKGTHGDAAPAGEGSDAMRAEADGRQIGYHPAAAWRSVIILLVFSLLSIMDRQIISLLVEPIKRDLGLSDTQLGLLQGLAFALMYSVAGLPIGWAVDRYPRRLIIYIGVTLWSLGAASCGLALNFWQFFLGRTTVGIGEASVAPVTVSLIGDLFPPDKIGAPLGVYAAGYSIGSGIAFLVGGFVISLFAGAPTVDIPLFGPVASWQAVLIVTGLPGFAIALLAGLLSEPGRARAPVASPVTAPAGEIDTISGFLGARGRVVALSFAGFALTTLGTYAVAGWTPAFLIRVHGLTAAQVGARFGLVMGIAGAIGNFAGGVIIDRLYRAGHRDAALLVPGIAMLISAPFLVGAYFVPSATLALALLALGFVPFNTAGPGSYTTWRMISPPSLRGRVTAAFVLVASLGGTGLGPLVVGALTDHLFGSVDKVGYSIALVLAVTMPLISLTLLLGRASLRAIGASASQPLPTGR